MKRIVICLLAVIVLVLITVTADVAMAARGHRDRSPTATNGTATIPTTDAEPAGGITPTGLTPPPSGWPSPAQWIGLATDDDENGCNDHRNVLEVYYYVDSDYMFLRMETVSPPGWPSTKPSGDARYKWWFNTEGLADVSGTSVYGAEFLLMLEDLTDNSNDPNMTRDLLGELTLMDDLNNDGFMDRWDSAKPPSYTVNNAQTAPTGPSSWWRRVLASDTDTPGVGGPQGVMGDDIGYRIDNSTTGGNFVDIYVSRAVLDNPSSLCLYWATDNQDTNLDQAPNCDRPVELYCIPLGKDYGDAPDPTYPTSMASDGARHDVSDYYLGAFIDLELDGIPSADAMGDDNNDLDDEDGVDFATALVQGQSADVTVTASAGGYLDAWLDFNADGDWADVGEKIFDELLIAGPNSLSFDVPLSAQAGETFARFRFSSAGGLSYDGPADDGEVEDYLVVIEGCTPPIAEFSADKTSCCAPLTVAFTDLSTGDPTSWDWDFGDGDTSSDPNPTHTYTSPGTYTVSLTVTNACGDDTETKESYIIVGGLPIADFEADPTYCCAPLEVDFTDLSDDNGKDIISWSWDFGDGDTSSDPNPTHTYTDPGTYTVSLTVTNACGDDTETKESYIIVGGLPIADFEADPTSGCAPLEVDFIDLSDGNGKDIISWSWDFGDGDTSSDPNPTHTYTSPGTYIVSLTVTNACGDDTETGQITARDCAPEPPAGGCPSTRYLTVDWEANNTTEILYSNDKLAKDLLGPSLDLSHNLFLERGTHAPVVGARTHYLIVVRGLEAIPALPDDTAAIVVFSVTPEGAGFDRDIFLTLGLNESQLPANALNVSMVYYDDINGAWMPLDYEAGGPSGVAELTLSAPINHFSIYGILAQLGSTPTQPAHFVPTGLTIVPSVQETVFVTRLGESVTISFNIFNDGWQDGTYTAVLKLNGQTVDNRTVTVPAGQSKQVSFTRSGLDYAQYEVEVAGLTGEFTASRTITWWLIVVIIAAVGLIIWAVVWATRRRKRATQEA